MEGREVLRTAAPFIAMGTAQLTKKALNAAHQKKTGEPLPSADDLDSPLVHVIAVTAGVAMVTAMINVAVTRTLATLASRNELTASDPSI